MATQTLKKIILMYFCKTVLKVKLFYLILGAIAKERNIEQHDVFFGIAERVEDLHPEIKRFWKGVILHIDCVQEVKFVDGYEIKIVETSSVTNDNQLFFINLGGYKLGHFEEFHEQHLMVGESMAEVIKRVKKTKFYRTMGFTNAPSHIDDKLGVDIDDIYDVNDLLSKEAKEKYAIILEKSESEHQENPMEVGYFKIK